MNTVWTPYEHHANTMWTPCKNRVYSRWTAAAEHYKKVPQIATREEKISSPSSNALLGEEKISSRSGKKKFLGQILSCKNYKFSAILTCNLQVYSDFDL